jgi:hypothetical protein
MLDAVNARTLHCQLGTDSKEPKEGTKGANNMAYKLQYGPDREEVCVVAPNGEESDVYEVPADGGTLFIEVDGKAVVVMVSREAGEEGDYGLDGDTVYTLAPSDTAVESDVEFEEDEDGEEEGEDEPLTGEPEER